jgi:hypothetical protein
MVARDLQRCPRAAEGGDVIKVFATAAGNVVQVTSYRDGSVELDIFTMSGQIAGHGMGKFTSTEAGELVAHLHRAIEMAPPAWREVEA